mmetsp:Transcript_21697/g.27982  ORF Transcript_21697/g.27982 Transcript_21697/m.27982 type:complete len:271 (-) Transcript_21697:489-1301(-)
MEMDVRCICNFLKQVFIQCLKQDANERDRIIRKFTKHLYAMHGLNTDVPIWYKGFKLSLVVLSWQARDDKRPWSDVVLLLNNLPPRMAEDALMRKDGKYKWIPLHWAARTAPRSVIDLMIELAPGSLRVKNSTGWLPVHYAALNNVDALEPLVNAYPDALVETDDRGNTPLYYAARGAPRPIIERILSSAPGTIRVKNSDGQLPLHNAADKSNVSACDGLINAYPEALFVEDDDGKTPLDSLNLSEVFKLNLVELSFIALSCERTKYSSE